MHTLSYMAVEFNTQIPTSLRRLTASASASAPGEAPFLEDFFFLVVFSLLGGVSAVAVALEIAGGDSASTGNFGGWGV